MLPYEMPFYALCGLLTVVYNYRAAAAKAEAATVGAQKCRKRKY